MFKTLGAIVDSIARAGHEVTVLSRGGTRRDLPGGTRKFHGDRYGSLDALRNERFDFVFDSCAFSPTVSKTCLTQSERVSGGMFWLLRSQLMELS